MKTAIQGVKGSYSEEAVRKIFGKDIEIVECGDFSETFAAVADNTAQYVVVPVENMIVGEIEEVTQLYRASNLKILDEVSLDIRHVLAGTPNSTFVNVKAVCSHVEALKQCRKFFETHNAINPEIEADTASSVRKVTEEGNVWRAALCSSRAAELYGAKILLEGVADAANNWTKFYLLGR